MSHLTPATRVTSINSAKSATTSSILFDKYIATKHIALGLFGEIWAVIDGQTQSQYALKTIREDLALTMEQKQAYTKNILSEFNLLAELSNKEKDPGKQYIVKSHRLLHDEVTQIGPYVVMELCGYSLLDYLRFFKSTNRKISFSTIRWISLQIFSGIRFIHNVGEIVHANLKPENILISYKDCQHSNFEPNPMPSIRIIDFGAAMEFNHKLPSSHYEIQSLAYRAPEVLLGNKNEISSLIDLWSIGCILCEMYAVNVCDEPHFKRLFPCKSIRDIVYKIYNEISPFCIYAYNEFNSFNYAKIFGSSSLVLETSYIKLKEFRKSKLMKRLASGTKSNSELEIKEFICFIDLVACLLDLNPFTRYNAVDAIQHQFIIDDFIGNGNKNNVKIQMTVSNDDNNKRQMIINQQLKNYQLLQTNTNTERKNNVYNAANPIVIKKALYLNQNEY